MTTSALPRPFGRYTLLRRLATGGMAEVYLAKMRGAAGFEKPVAIKRIHPRLAATEASGASLSHEAKLSVGLSHPNIVQTFDLGHAEGADYLVMEHVEGRDAQQVLDALGSARRAFPIDLAAHVVSGICRGLAYAHAAREGLVHRDVSPQNVLLSFAGEVKLADFGIAQTRSRRSDPEARIIKGKYFYMSPEQARAEPLDARSDIFSAGVVLWELLAGRRLHQARDVRVLLECVRRAEVPPPSTLRPLVPPALDAVVARATARERSKRYGSADEMADALDAYLATRPPLHAARRIGRLLQDLPPSESPPELAPFPLPQTRDVVATESPERGTPPEPPLRHDLDDGRPTAVGWRAPSAEKSAPHLAWGIAAGAALVIVAAWLLHGL